MENDVMFGGTSGKRMLGRSRTIWLDTKNIKRTFNFNSVQRTLVLEDYAPPALRVQGFVSRKKGARSMGEEKKEGGKNKIKK